jgi:NitT/TauT family transport system ATP-binding protein
MDTIIRVAQVSRFAQVSRSFVHGRASIPVLINTSLQIEQGRFVVLVGPSGCGKTTLLHLMAGLLSPTAGRIYYQGRPLSSPHLTIGYLTQKETLLPWRTIAHNIALPLEIRGVHKKEQGQQVSALMRKVGLEGCEQRYPASLSGGMLRRASLARMLVSDPKTLLLDEPFGALDAQLRLDLQRQLLALWEHSGTTVVFVTHDLEEAIALGDRVIVLGKYGRIMLDEEIPLPRPRDAATIRFSADFMALHQRLWQTLGEARTSEEVAS